MIVTPVRRNRCQLKEPAAGLRERAVGAVEAETLVA
jgi:hypothetical protein